MSAAATAPPLLVIPFGPTGTPVVSPLDSMPLHSPGWAPPPTDTQLADPRDPCHCPRHDPVAGYFRNTNGAYGSAVPACSGCHRGDRDAQETQAARRVIALDHVLRTRLRDDLPSSTTTQLAADLFTAIADLEALTTEIPTPIDYANRAIRIWETATALHAALVRYNSVRLVDTTTPDELTNIRQEVRDTYLAHVESLDRFTPTTRIATRALESDAVLSG
jgi:hypothetical protein